MCGSPRQLAALPSCRVDLCTCGNLHLHIGPVTMRVTAEVLAQLADVSWLAVTALRDAPMREDAAGDGNPPR